mmetsp:Transcript_5059/g.10336  ORF Transcript_5059/g.10336 Transcript_5059/m.10336 type:complete len:573 (-) Transcript_5059:105-1823(-)|eukprot:scaffold521_cov167-Amphora_coffeaeformis.AAC.40
MMIYLGRSSLACLIASNAIQAFQPLLQRNTARRSPTILYDTGTTPGPDECQLDDEGEALNDCLVNEGYTADDHEELFITKIYKAKLEHLSARFQSSNKPNRRVEFTKPQMPPRFSNNTYVSDPEERNSHVFDLQYSHLMTDNDIVLADCVRRPDMQPVSRAFVRAGPRASLHFDPPMVNAAIVTCGGLCPGLNNVVRELTHALYYIYGVNAVWGVRGGFHGFHADVHDEDFYPVLLTPEKVEDIHHEGGTVLRSSRGGFDIDKILDFLAKKNIQQLYVIGGDGTHRGAYAIHQACMKSDLNVAVAGIPKTIDNDVDYIDRSFGFLTAVEAAQASIHSAKTEATCVMPNGVTVVKLMGRSAGFLAATSALGSGDVDAVLVPEVPIVLDGEDGILPFIYHRCKEQKYAVVVVAEGAGEDILGKSTQVDKGGNRKLPPIGEFIRDQIKDYFTAQGEDSTVRYIDPSYTVRSVPANAADSIYCTDLAQNAVHGTMAGYTGFSVGLINNQCCYIPIPQLVATSPRQMNPRGQIWERVLAMTGQPSPISPKEQTMEKSNSGGIMETSDHLQMAEPNIF